MDVIDSSNVLPVTELSSSVDDIDAVLEDGSDAQARFVHDMKENMALALGVDVTAIEISSIRPAEDVPDQGTGRRTQTAGEVTFDLQITGPDATAALTSLSEQLADPNSALRTSAGITSEAPAFTFVCPIGMVRPLGAPECSYCSDTSIPDSANSFRTCKECVPGQAPDLASHSRCVCADGYYNSSAGTNLVKCYADGEPWAALTPTSDMDCLSCAETGCDVDAISCTGGSVMLMPDFSVSATSVSQAVPLHDMTGQRSVYACAVPGACLGDLAPTEEDVETIGGAKCSAPYDGPLCDYCADGYSRPGFTGECTTCSEGLSTAWAVIGTIIAIASVTTVLYWISALDGTATKTGVMLTLGKIGVSLVQVLTQLEFCLEVSWPETFRWFVNLMKFFSMDLLGFLDIGCLTQYTCKFSFHLSIGKLDAMT